MTEIGDLLSTGDGTLTLRHPEHQESYHSKAGAGTEARHLYIEASGLRKQLTKRQPITILDVGLGLGYNALSTIEAWQQTRQPQSVTLLSLECDASLVDALVSSEIPWSKGWLDSWRQAAAALHRQNQTNYSAVFNHESGAELTWHIHLAPAEQIDFLELTQQLQLRQPFDYIWQDPFSPTNNPTMWSIRWFTKLCQASSSHCILMSYSVARSVKDNLTASGWTYARINAVGTAKRHWLKASPTLQDSI